MILSLKEIPEGWFLKSLGESVTPIHYRGDMHENDGKGFFCHLQHRDGGKQTTAYGLTPDEAMSNCLSAIERMWPDFIP